MTLSNEMYSAKNNSPITTLTAALNSSDSVMSVEDASVFPDAPNLAVIGTSENAEIVLYTAKNGNDLTIRRGLHDTTPGTWAEGTSVARNFTAYDHDAFKENIEELDENKQDVLEFDTVPVENSTNPVESGGLYSELLNKAYQGSVGRVFSELATYAKDDCVMYQGKLYRFNSAHTPGPWVGGNEVTETNALAESGGGGGSAGVGDEITFDDNNNAMIITSSSRSISSLESAVAIIATVIEGSESHPAITSGQYVYVTMHTGVSGLVDLPEGLYVANSNISANAALNTTNLSSVSGGGLNTLLDKTNKLEVLVVTKQSISSLPVTVNTGSALQVEDDMVVLQSTFTNPSVATSNWTVKTYNGYLTIEGSIASGASTDLTLYLMKSR